MTEADDTIRVSKSRLREVKDEIDRLTAASSARSARSTRTSAST